MSLQLTLDTWLSNNNSYNQTEQFRNLVEALDYDGLTDFFYNNSGCIDACYSWIGKQNSKEWNELLAIPLREDIQNLLDNGFIELEFGTNNRYIGISTIQVILIEDRAGARYLVGSIEIGCDSIAFYDEADNLINDVKDNYAYGYNLK